MQDGQSITETEKEDGNGLDTSSPARGAETDIIFDTLSPKSDSTTITQLQEETASPTDIGGIGQQQEPVCKHCPAKDARITELEETVRAHTFIKSAEELMHKSTDGYQQLEFSVSCELLRQHMVYFNGINGPLPDSVWFNGKFDYRTGKVEGRIGRTTGTDTTDVSRMTP